MNRKKLRASKKEGKRLIRLGWNAFEDITEDARSKLAPGTGFPDRVFQNNIFIVQVFFTETEWGLMERAMIRRNDTAPVHNWGVIQRVKNEVFGEERTAVEVYPRHSKLIDVANIYWLWVFPYGYDCPVELS